jgi:hypothetical protein
MATFTNLPYGIAPGGGWLANNQLGPAPTPAPAANAVTGLPPGAAPNLNQVLGSALPAGGPPGAQMQGLTNQAGMGTPYGTVPPRANLAQALLAFPGAALSPAAIQAGRGILAGQRGLGGT